MVEATTSDGVGGHLVFGTRTMISPTVVLFFAYARWMNTLEIY